MALWMVLLSVGGGSLLWLKRHFGWGQTDIAPAIATPAPESTPLPLGVAATAAAPPSEWKSITLPGQRAARAALWLTPAYAKPSPLVIVLHGDGGDARGFHQQFMYEEASGSWATVVYPDGLGHGWDTETAVDNPDVAFLDALIDEAVRARNVDPARIFLTGYSSGGFLAQLYACQRSSRVRGIATHEAGAPYNQAEKWPNGSPRCPGQDKVATLVTHGRDDFSVSFKSGVYSALYWATINGCDPRHARVTAYPQCYAYDGCAPGKPVVFCDIPNLGHWVWSEGAVASVRFFQRLGE